MSEYSEGLERLGATIVEQLGSDDPLERKKLIGAIEVGQRVAEFLQCELADEDTWVDTGSGGSSYDCEVKVNGREYSVTISPGSTDEEAEQWEAELSAEAQQWDSLMPRVLEALRASDPALAVEFDGFINPKKPPRASP